MLRDEEDTALGRNGGASDRSVCMWESDTKLPPVLASYGGPFEVILGVVTEDLERLAAQARCREESGNLTQGVSEGRYG